MTQYDKDRMREYQKKYRQEHQEQSRLYYDQHKNHLREYKQKYRQGFKIKGPKLIIVIYTTVWLDFK
jgi:hypothetical protein